VLGHAQPLRRRRFVVGRMEAEIAEEEDLRQREPDLAANASV
jgi:hypothetical protein